MRLEGKVCIVTGAGAGIGRESCLLFAEEGARVLCADLNEETAVETAALASAVGDAVAVVCDVADDSSVAGLVARAVQEFGRLDVYFANAGIVPGGAVLECSDADWDRAMAVNVRSVLLACRHGIPAMQRAGGGAIVCTASVAGLVGVKNRAAYSASKAAVLGLVKSVAIDYVASGIRINAICPGTVDTPSLQARLHAMGDYEEARRQFVARQPMGRLGTAREIAQLALYLASDESGYMTGSHLVIDGGLSL